MKKLNHAYLELLPYRLVFMVLEGTLQASKVVCEVLLYICCFYWLMNKESALACDSVE